MDTNSRSLFAPKRNNLFQPINATFNRQTGFILLHLDKIDYGFRDRLIRYKERLFQPKQELHITVVSHAAAELVYKHLINHPEDLEKIQELLISTNWTYRKLDQFFYVEQEPEVATIIQMVDMPYLVSFLKDLSKVVNQGISRPPAHVTLYTRGTDLGIGLPDQAVFNALVKERVNPWQIKPEAG